MRTRYHEPQVEDAVKALGMAGEWGAIWVAIGLAAAAVDAPRPQRWLRAASVAPAAVGVNYAVKLAVGRPRPRLRRLPPLAAAPSELSFPSAHATSSLAAATAMGRVAPGARPPLYGLAAAIAAARALGRVAPGSRRAHYALAAAICLSRPYLGMHYPSDVLGGAVIGLMIGRLWPGLRGKGAEDRLIDLVMSAAPTPAAAAGGGSAAGGRTRAAAAETSGHRPAGEGEPGRS
jgi:membrane-associated phospholipid phosphatase